MDDIITSCDMWRYKQEPKTFEMMKRKELNCSICGKPFMPKINFQIHCSSDCAYSDLKKSNEMECKLYDRQCVTCGIYFRKPEKQGSSIECETCRKSRYKASQEAKMDRIDKWVKAKKKKGLSLEELNRRMEWKRVWDDEGWAHYLAGNRWDKI